MSINLVTDVGSYSGDMLGIINHVHILVASLKYVTCKLIPLSTFSPQTVCKLFVNCSVTPYIYPLSICCFLRPKP